MSENLLPPGFAALEPFVTRWAIAGSAERAAARGAAPAQERQAFFAAARPLIDRALDYLDARPLAQLSEAEQHLLNLMLSLAHVAMAVEVHGPDEDRMTRWRHRMRITRSPADS